MRSTAVIFRIRGRKWKADVPLTRIRAAQISPVTKPHTAVRASQNFSIAILFLAAFSHADAGSGGGNAR